MIDKTGKDIFFGQRLCVLEGLESHLLLRNPITLQSMDHNLNFQKSTHKAVN